MSTQINHYVMYGVLLPYPEHPKFTDEMHALLEPYCDSAFETATNPKDGLTVLVDGMGQYIAIGHVIAKSAVNDGFEKPVQIGSLPYREYDSGVRHNLISSLGLEPTEFNPGWIVLSHYR